MDDSIRESKKYLGTSSNNHAVNPQNQNMVRNNSIINSQKSDNEDTGNNYYKSQGNKPK